MPLVCDNLNGEPIAAIAASGKHGIIHDSEQCIQNSATRALVPLKRKEKKKTEANKRDEEKEPAKTARATAHEGGAHQIDQSGRLLVRRAVGDGVGAAGEAAPPPPRRAAALPVEQGIVHVANRKPRPRSEAPRSEAPSARARGRGERE